MIGQRLLEVDTLHPCFYDESSALFLSTVKSLDTHVHMHIIQKQCADVFMIPKR